MLNPSRALLVLLCTGIVSVVAITAFADPVVTTYSISGSPGNWMLDFSVTNNIGISGMDVYYVGFSVPSGSISGLPANWIQYDTYPLQAYDYGVSIPDMIQNGETLGGFRVSVANLPTQIPWFAYAYNWENPGANPSYEGIAAESNPTVPEPTSLLFLGTGLGILGLAGWRRRK
jgi:hypothetical protein